MSRFPAARRLPFLPLSRCCLSLGLLAGVSLLVWSRSDRQVSAEESVKPAPGKPAAAEKAATEKATTEKADAPRVLVPTREFKKEGPAGAYRLSYDDIDLEKIINMKKTTLDAPELLPKWLKELKGQRVRLRGYMVPHSVFQQTGNRKFVLARDTGACCFGPNPTIYYLVEVDLKKGNTTDYIDNRPFDVEGEFGIESEELDGTIYRFYQLHNAMIVKK